MQYYYQQIFVYLLDFIEDLHHVRFLTTAVFRFSLEIKLHPKTSKVVSLLLKLHTLLRRAPLPLQL